MIARIRKRIQSMTASSRLTPLSQQEIMIDHRGLTDEDHGIEAVVQANLSWLCRAQDESTSCDGGVARHFGLENGWAPSYPETTGYIVPTFLACARSWSDDHLRDRARRMLDWLVSIQFPEGGFQGGVVGAEPRVPVTFNTGQILIGLAAGHEEFGDYGEAMRRAADWLVDTQDSDGAWRSHPTPFAKRGDKVYETHVAWGLLEVARVTGESRYCDAALANVDWALKHQTENGWLRSCCLDSSHRPLTHTLGYALRGFVEAYLFSRERRYLDSARRTADGILGRMREDGHLPGRLHADWSAASSYSCLTGTVQIAACWLLLYRETGDERYRVAAKRANQYVRRTVRVGGNPNISGAVKGSFPVDGGYGRLQFLNWACKFCADSNLLELAVG